MANLQIVDVEFGGRLAGPYRVMVVHEFRAVVLYLTSLTLAKVAEEAADALLIRRLPGQSYFLAKEGVHLDGRHVLDGDLVAELGVRRAGS